MTGRWLAPGSLFAFSALAQTPAALIAEGEKLIEAREFGQAQPLFERAVRQDPAQFGALAGLGFIAFSEGRPRDARAFLEKAVKLRPHSFQTRFLLGAVLVELKENNAAIGQLRLAHKLNPAHVDARKLLAIEYYASRQFRPAIALLTPVVEQRPYDLETHLLLISALQGAGDTAGSFQLAERAAGRFPQSCQVAAWLGFQLQFSGRYQEAEPRLREAIALDPRYGVPYQLLGEMFLQREKYLEAVHWFRQAAERMPEDAETLIGLGRALAETGNTAGAIETLRAAALADPDNAQAHLHLSRVYFRLGDEAAAQKEADLSVKLRAAAPSPAAIPLAPSSLRGTK